jgi:hypothetical protein
MTNSKRRFKKPRAKKRIARKLLFRLESVSHTKEKIMSTSPQAVAVPHVSWLHKLGSVVAKVLGLAQKVEHAVLPVAELILPQFAPEIAAADAIFSKTVAYIEMSEGTFAAVDQASNGPAKLSVVVSSIGPQIDAWIASNFPGSKALSAGVKVGYVNAVVAMLNELDGNLVAINPQPATLIAAAAAKAAVVASVSAAGIAPAVQTPAPAPAAAAPTPALTPEQEIPESPALAAALSAGLASLPQD